MCSMKLIKIIFCFCLVMLLFSCGSKKRALQEQRSSATKKHQTTSDFSSEKDYPDNIVKVKEETDRPRSSFGSVVKYYIYTYAPIAKNEMELYGIPASITLAQGILESGAGQGELTKKSNNHFGIKCNGWQGAKVYHDDDRAQECFRKYKDAKYSFRDHSLFLSGRGRYAFLFTLRKDDYKGWARGLKKAGYATDPRYPAKLINLIERYNLDRFDDQVLGNSNREGRPNRNVRVDYSSNKYTVEDGDTLWNISKRHDLTVEQLKEFNGLRGNKISIGQKLYVERR